MWKSICLKNDLPLGKLKQLWGGGNIFLMKIKIKLPGRAKFRNHDYQISFLKNYSIIWCYYFWRVLLVITNPSFWLFHFVPQYTLISPPHLFQENWHDHKKIWKFHQFPLPIVQGGAGGGGGWWHESVALNVKGLLDLSLKHIYKFRIRQ